MFNTLSLWLKIIRHWEFGKAIFIIPHLVAVAAVVAAVVAVVVGTLLFHCKHHEHVLMGHNSIFEMFQARLTVMVIYKTLD